MLLNVIGSLKCFNNSRLLPDVIIFDLYTKQTKKESDCFQWLGAWQGRGEFLIRP